MKILYIVDEDISTNSGVTQKIKTQIEVWERSGNTVKLISLRSRGSNGVVPNSKILVVFEGSFFLKTLNFLKTPLLLQKEIEYFKPEIIYSRFIYFRPFLVSALKSGSKYVVELNSIDVEEFKLLNFKHYWYNILTRNWFLRGASAFISVTNEILTHTSFSRFGKKGCVIGNGVEVSKFADFIRPAHNESGLINVAFIGTPGQKWHGLDKMLYLASLCPDYKFHIVGLSLREIKNCGGYDNQKNVIIYNYQSEADSKEIIRSCQIGISTLALHRIAMGEACPLKSRQYLSQGLPMIVGYEDPDFSDQPFILNIGNYENNVRDNINKIRDFIASVAQISPGVIVEFAKENLDVNVKEKMRLDFINRIIN